MTLAIADTVRDPVLYRFLAFVAWKPKESTADSERRIEVLNATLSLLGWAPTDSDALPSRTEMDWKQRRLWQSWNDPVDGWAVDRSALGYHETATVLCGVGEAGLHPLVEPWVAGARARWSGEFGADEEWMSRVIVPGGGDSQSHPSLLGQTWLVTAEYDALPSTTWEVFGQERYPDGYILFPWGILGTRSTHPDPPIFELLTLREQGVKECRDSFLYGDLCIVLAEYVKATQYLWVPYEQAHNHQLSEIESRLNARADASATSWQDTSLQGTEHSVRELTSLLFHFSKTVSDLEYDVRGMELARDAVRDLLALNGSQPAGGFRGLGPFGSVERVHGQLSSDLAYFRTTEERGRMTLETHQILVDIENTRGQNRLAAIAFFVGIAIGLGQLLGTAFPLRVTVPISLAVAVVLAGGYWLWTERKRSAVPRGETSERQGS